MDDIIFKTCTGCRKEKRIEEFPYNKRKDREGYYLNNCKPCYSEIRKAHRKTYNPWIDKVSKLKARAKELGIDFDLTAKDLEDLWNKQGGKCFYMDIPMEIGWGKGLKPNSASVDKVLPWKGYTKDNVVLCTTRANTIKSNLDMNELSKYIPSWWQKLYDAFPPGTVSEEIEVRLITTSS
ncbi:HNH endonuclease [Streptomyces phage Persimmon]|nr:HNH endonuclease [Streptomyces phage Persimmon]